MDSTPQIRQLLITFYLKYHFNRIFLLTLQQEFEIYKKYHNYTCCISQIFR